MIINLYIRYPLEKFIQKKKNNQESDRVSSSAIKKNEKWGLGHNSIKKKLKKIEKKGNTYLAKSSEPFYEPNNKHILKTTNFVDQIRPISEN